MQHDVSGDPAVPGRSRVLVLGSAGLDRELVIALRRLGAEVIAADRHAGAPLHGVADQAVVIDLADTDELSALLARLQPRFVVTAADVVATGVLPASAEVLPGFRAARLSGDFEAMRRLAADELGLPTAPFWFAGTVDELRAIAEHAGFPMMVRPVAGPPGEGQSLLVRLQDVEPAWHHAAFAAGPVAPHRVLAETVVDVDHRVTLLAVRSTGPDGPMVEFCAPIGHRGIEGPDGRLVEESWQPQALSPAALDAAKSIAARVARELGGRGVFGVELLVSGDEVYFAGVTARPRDVAWVTLRTQRLSVFDLQARAILGLPVDTIMISPGAARLSYADREAASGTVPPAALNVAESDALMFGDDGCYADGVDRRCRLGVALATGPDVATARDRAEQVSTALGKLWS